MIQKVAWLLVALGVAWLIVAWLVMIRRLRRELRAMRMARHPSYTIEIGGNGYADDHSIAVYERAVLYDWSARGEL